MSMQAGSAAMKGKPLIESDRVGGTTATNVGGNVMLGRRAGLQVDGEGAASSETGTPCLLPCEFA